MLDVQLTNAQRDLLALVPEHFPIQRVDRIWIFTPHVGKVRETGLLVVTLLPPEEETTAQRTLFTLRYVTEPTKKGVERTDTLTEEGKAPPERIDRVIEGVLARAGEVGGEPLVAPIEGEPDRWLELLERVGIRVDPATG